MILLTLVTLTASFCLGLARPGGDLPTVKRHGLGPESYIIGGEQATSGQWPSALSLEFFSLNNGWTHVCGATLFRNQYALTSATCLLNNAVSDLRLRGGVIFRDNPGATNGQLLPIARYVVHPEFNLFVQGVPHDIGIIFLTFPADTSADNVQNAVLPPNTANSFVHGNCFAVGYGRYIEEENSFSNTLQWVRMFGLFNDDCANRVQGVDQARIYPGHYCLLSDPPGKGPCNGDVGSAIYCNPSASDTSVLYVSGVVSWNAGSSGRCNLQFPIVTTRVSEYLEWINDLAP